MRFLATLGVAAALTLGWVGALRAEPPRRDPVRLVVAAESVVLGRVVEVQRIETPHEGHGLQEVAVAKLEVLETWKGDAGRKTAFFLASPTWTCDVTHAVEGETGVFFLRPYVAGRGLGGDEAALGTDAFAKGVAKLVGDDTLKVLALSGAGRMPLTTVAETLYAEVSLAGAGELLPHLWSTWGPDPRYPYSRLVEVTTLRILVKALSLLPEGEDVRTLFDSEDEPAWAAFERLTAKPGREALEALALARIAAPHDDELLMRVGDRIEAAGDEAWTSLLSLSDHAVPLVPIGVARLLYCGGDRVPLTPLLEGADAGVRRVLARALVERGRHSWDVDGDDAVLASLLADEDAEVRRLAVTATLLSADAWTAEEVEPLLRAARDPDARVRRVALYGLGEPGWSFAGPVAARRALEALRRGLKDDDLSVRRAASGGVLDLVRNVKEFPPDEPEAIEATARYLADAAQDLRAAAGSPDPKVRGTALAALGGCAGAEGVEDLKDALTDESPWIRRCAAHGLGWVEADTAVEALKTAVQDDDELARVVAVEALVRVGTPAAAAQVLATLESGSGAARWAAAEGLGKVGGEGARPALLEALLEGEPEVQWRAAVALRELGVESIPLLVHAVREADGYGADRALYALQCFLFHRDEQARLLGVRTLGDLGADDKETIRRLERRLDDPSAAVRAAVGEVLEQLRKE